MFCPFLAVGEKYAGPTRQGVDNERRARARGPSRFSGGTPGEAGSPGTQAPPGEPAEEDRPPEESRQERDFPGASTPATSVEDYQRREE